MFGLKATLITGAVGLAVSLGLAFLWKTEQVKSARLETQLTSVRGELERSIDNNKQLKELMEGQKETLRTALTITEKNGEKVNELENERDQARVETAYARAEVDALRAAEANKALAAPFSRGNTARDRFANSLQRIAGETGGTVGSGNDPSVAQGGATE